MTQELLKVIHAGKISFKIHKVYSLENASEAHKDLEGGKTVGKLILNCQQEE